VDRLIAIVGYYESRMGRLIQISPIVPSGVDRPDCGWQTDLAALLISPRLRRTFWGVKRAYVAGETVRRHCRRASGARVFAAFPKKKRFLVPSPKCEAAWRIAVSFRVIR
jgi:hypothetical protein